MKTNNKATTFALKRALAVVASGISIVDTERKLQHSYERKRLNERSQENRRCEEKIALVIKV